MWNRSNTYRVELLAQVSTGIDQAHMTDGECIALAVKYARKLHEGPLHHLVVEGGPSGSRLSIKTRAETFGGTGSVRAPVVSHGLLMKGLHCRDEPRVVVLVFLDVFEGDVYQNGQEADVRNVLVWRTATTEEAQQLAALSPPPTAYKQQAKPDPNLHQQRTYIVEKNNAKNANRKPSPQSKRDLAKLAAAGLSLHSNPGSGTLVSKREIHDVGAELRDVFGRDVHGKNGPPPPPVPDKPMSVIMLFNQKKASLGKSANRVLGGGSAKTTKNAGQLALSLAPSQDLVAYGRSRNEVLASDVPKIVAETKKKGNKLKRKPAIMLRQQLTDQSANGRQNGVVPLSPWFSWMAIPSWIARPIFYQDFYANYHPPMITGPPTQRCLVAPPPPAGFNGKKRSVLRTSSLSSQEESSGSDNEAHHSPKESLRGKKMVTFNYLATVKLV